MTSDAMQRIPAVIAITPKIASRTEIAPPSASMPAGFRYEIAVDSENWNRTGFKAALTATPTKPMPPPHRTGRHRREGSLPVGYKRSSRASEPAVSTSESAPAQETHRQAGSTS